MEIKRVMTDMKDMADMTDGKDRKNMPDMEEYSVIWDICNAIGPREVILSITKECPYDQQHKSCPIKEIEEWRKMEFKEVYDQINKLPVDTLKELVEKHCLCSYLLASKSKKE
jgi:hypothetical protein